MAGLERPRLSTLATIGGCAAGVLLILATAVTLVAASATTVPAAAPGPASDPPAVAQAPGTPLPIDREAEPRACALAAAALAKGDADRAVAILEAAHITSGTAAAVEDSACRSTLTLATGLADEPPAKTAPQTFGAAWDGFVKAYATPLATAGGFLLGGWLALFVLARLMVEFLWVGDLRSTRESRTAAGWTGLAALLAVPLVVLWLAPVISGAPGAFVPIAWLLLGLAGIAGALVLAGWLATRLRMTFTVTASGDGDDVKAIDRPRLVGALTRLVGSRRQLELPAGPSLAELGTSLTGLSTIGWVAALQKIVLFLVGAAPWTVTVDVSSATEASLTIARNGRGIVSRALRTDGPGLEMLASPPEGVPQGEFLIDFLAADVVAALRTRYAEDLDPGLYGATNARGIALQYIATEYYTRENEDATASAIVAQALASDPYNELAQYSMRYFRHRRETEVAQLRSQIDRLSRALDARIAHLTAGGVPLEVDDLLWGQTQALAAAGRNLAACSAPDADTAASMRDIVDRLDTAADWDRAWLPVVEIRNRENNERMSLLALTIAARFLEGDTAAVTAEERHELDGFADDPAMRNSPALAYSLACLRMRWGGAGFDDVSKDLLSAARNGVPTLAAFIAKDPELTTSAHAGAVVAWAAALDAADERAAAEKAAADAAAARRKARDGAIRYVVRLQSASRRARV